ncbi:MULTISPECIES: sigma-70 family RNA polymerase sigma factor [unclassified Pseudomonas]|jgi:RNA polymerase sigma factor (sigma-70 family)|uniref:sigma-70 family RNA polymerase sigma factor n=1 Tax=unclassified Pseudomonas TaxID=196821 RepID=UPI0015A410F7|nr:MULTISPECIES: sigma-70 family RNA polymerase sigma factor [unclassified Pseudomonas]MDQ0667564.1 RNA polymerase sigma factor (sigma-70 family) [Pseudomonas sp. W2I6]NVZ13613.1 sigma-70 family RNA polymerase sigma factor [Pseudomonas sp. IPO3775]NVZ31773.1 sigma-70 family RNA polymerase sigma factor [Pseudomonas sp. A4002]NWA30776.1 sigma-70 family RNA polymerase sigma factor [Pseudomonas sp. C6002]NWA77592.1 sigma-70 family RNA polymerase sigma factor [Pseudomonas sp. C8002]
MNNRSSFEQDVEHLYLEHSGWLKNWLRKRLHETADADDLAQDTFVRIIGARRPVNELRQPLAYLATIANSLLINRWRRQAVERAYQHVLAEQPQALEISPEDKYLLIETLVEVDELLHGMPAGMREIFLLSQLDGLTYKQIGSQLGLSVDKVQKSMSKAFALCYASQFE